jgi:FMN-dependent NADH-azoreductase
VLVIGVPVYNFSIPATLKTWIDLIARARLTFRYTEQGPEGLVKGKKAYLAVATGGVAVDSAADFATPYMRHLLGFIGITDVEIVAAERINVDAATAMDAARARIAELVHLPPQAA